MDKTLILLLLFQVLRIVLISLELTRAQLAIIRFLVLLKIVSVKNYGKNINLLIIDHACFIIDFCQIKLAS